MKENRVLIANRGEIGYRIARCAIDIGIDYKIVFAPEDEQNCLDLHDRQNTVPLKGRGIDAYLDEEQLLAIAKKENCNILHPGYGFLAESNRFAEKCCEADIIWVGPSPDNLAIFGNKIEATALAKKLRIFTLPSSRKLESSSDLKNFLRTLKENDKAILKASHGGGGRGMRIVDVKQNLDKVFAGAMKEVSLAFGSTDLYAEKFLEIYSSLIS